MGKRMPFNPSMKDFLKKAALFVLTVAVVACSPQPPTGLVVPTSIATLEPNQDSQDNVADEQGENVEVEEKPSVKLYSDDILRGVSTETGNLRNDYVNQIRTIPGWENLADNQVEVGLLELNPDGSTEVEVVVFATINNESQTTTYVFVHDYLGKEQKSEEGILLKPLFPVKENNTYELLLVSTCASEAATIVSCTAERLIWSDENFVLHVRTVDGKEVTNDNVRLDEAGIRSDMVKVDLKPVAPATTEGTIAVESNQVYTKLNDEITHYWNGDEWVKVLEEVDISQFKVDEVIKLEQLSHLHLQDALKNNKDLWGYRLEKVTDEQTGQEAPYLVREDGLKLAVYENGDWRALTPEEKHRTLFDKVTRDLPRVNYPGSRIFEPAKKAMFTDDYFNIQVEENGSIRTFVATRVVSKVNGTLEEYLVLAAVDPNKAYFRVYRTNEFNDSILDTYYVGALLSLIPTGDLGYGRVLSYTLYVEGLDQATLLKKIPNLTIRGGVVNTDRATAYHKPWRIQTDPDSVRILTPGFTWVTELSDQITSNNIVPAGEILLHRDKGVNAGRKPEKTPEEAWQDYAANPSAYDW